MDEQAWLLLKKVFQQALECAPEDRAKLLDTACAGKPDVRTEVEGVISYLSPLAQGMLGLASGETVSVVLPAGSVELEVIAVEPADD